MRFLSCDSSDSLMVSGVDDGILFGFPIKGGVDDALHPGIIKLVPAHETIEGTLECLDLFNSTQMDLPTEEDTQADKDGDNTDHNHAFLPAQRGNPRQF